jgi:hypothetical protein
LFSTLATSFTRAPSKSVTKMELAVYGIGRFAEGSNFASAPARRMELRATLPRQRLHRSERRAMRFDVSA